LAFEEFIAHDTICDFLEKQGYTVTRKAYGVETAFEVVSGEGGRLISINAEYDALPEIGHACGHHLIAAVGISAFLGLSAALKARGIPGRVQLLGTPAEESGGGKVSLLNAGAYKGVDAALMRSVNYKLQISKPTVVMQLLSEYQNNLAAFY
jgi:metal-dependent amidase/aminoacylase/carboxypeptidase family protein